MNISIQTTIARDGSGKPIAVLVDVPTVVTDADLIAQFKLDELARQLQDTAMIHLNACLDLAKGGEK